MITKHPEGIEVIGKGTGVIAERTFQKYEFICEYRREVITKHEAQEQERKYTDEGCYMYYFDQRNLGKACVDRQISFASS